MSERIVIVSLDRKIGHWIGAAMRCYGIETFPKSLYKKIIMGARDHLRSGNVPAARAYIFRKISKRWQYLNSERIEEFIEEQYGPFPLPNSKENRHDHA